MSRGSPNRLYAQIPATLTRRVKINVCNNVRRHLSQCFGACPSGTKKRG
jgi:hypothetical protein